MNWSKGTVVYWLCFAATQLVGFVSGYNANVHIDPFPLLLGLVLLLPGDLLAFLADRWDPNPGLGADIVFGAVVVLINGGFWFGIRKLLRSGDPQTPPPNSITGQQDSRVLKL